MVSHSHCVFSQCSDTWVCTEQLCWSAPLHAQVPAFYFSKCFPVFGTTSDFLQQQHVLAPWDNGTSSCVCFCSVYGLITLIHGNWCSCPRWVLHLCQFFARISLLGLKAWNMNQVLFPCIHSANFWTALQLLDYLMFVCVQSRCLLPSWKYKAVCEGLHK